MSSKAKSARASSSNNSEKKGMARFLSHHRSIDEWFTRMAVENGFSFNQMASREFLALGFRNLGMKPLKSRSWVSSAVNKFICGLQEEAKARLQDDFASGKRCSIVIDEWTSVSNHRFLNVCVVSDSECINLGLARCLGSMTAQRTADLVEVMMILFCFPVPELFNTF